MKSESIKELAAALSKAQSEMHSAKKDTPNPFLKSKYADLASCWEACREPLTKNGLSVIQTTRITEHGNTVLITTLAHTSGEWISGEFPLKAGKDDMQSLGSALTYSRRYGLTSIVGLTQEDDDGHAATQPRPAAPAPQRPMQTVRTTNPMKT
jgi:hypothetical protein